MEPFAQFGLAGLLAGALVFIHLRTLKTFAAEQQADRAVHEKHVGLMVRGLRRIGQRLGRLETALHECPLMDRQRARQQATATVTTQVSPAPNPLEELKDK